MSAWGIAPGASLKRDESRFQRWIGTYYFPGALPQAANERCAVGAKRILAVSAA